MMCYPAYGHNEVFSLLAPKGPRACLQMQSWLQEKLSKVGEDELSLPPSPALQGSNNCFNLCRGSDGHRLTS